ARSRGRALGWWTAAGAGGGASGWVLGGLVTELAGWRWVFAVNVPIGLVALLLARAALPVPSREPGSRSTRGRLDLRGSVLLTTGIALACLGCTLLGEHVTGVGGWVVAAAAVVVLVLAVGHERRVADPLVSGRLLRTPGVVVGNLTAATLTGSTTPAMLTAVLYVQQTTGLSPARGSLLFPAFNLAVIGGSLLGPVLLARAGVRLVLLTGSVAVVGGTALLLLLPAQGVPVVLLLAAFAVSGAGLGAASVASTTAGTTSVGEADRGVAAGLLNSSAQLGQALGLAAVSPLVASAAPMTGYRLGFVAAALVGVAGAVIASGYGRRPAADQRPGDRPHLTSVGREE
ncbi:MFS transporter, partial [Desertihabitans aurantiacus]|uniref:MFS transporter n=1 Tax=Desertihabitans aurantiacus TaxID=2282477 RepID=UPI000DF80289